MARPAAVSRALGQMSDEQLHLLQRGPSIRK